MNKELKKVIVLFVVENENDFQLVNNTVEKFRPYIYDSSGSYLIGGQDVSDFISNFIRLYK